MKQWLPTKPYPPGPCRVVFYVPSKIKDGSIVPADREKLLQAVRSALVTLFLGSTEYNATGSFRKDGDGPIITENVTLCYACCTEKLFEEHIREINQLANALAIEFQQDTIAVELNGTMYNFAPTDKYVERYRALKDKVTSGGAQEWGYEKWLQVALDAQPSNS